MKKSNSFSKNDSYYQYTRTEMLPFIPENVKRVIEIGCGEGSFGNLIKARIGAEVWGVELDKKKSLIAKKKLDKIITGDIYNNIEKLPRNYFDCVIFNDVLEHLLNPWDVLGKIRKILTAHGVIVASIPNMRHFDTLYELVVNKEWNYVQEGILDITHLRFFTIKSMRKMFEKTGYRVIRQEGINVILKRKYIFHIMNIFSFGLINDAKFLQFAMVVEKTRDRPAE